MDDNIFDYTRKIGNRALYFRTGGNTCRSLLWICNNRNTISTILICWYVNFKSKYFTLQGVCNFPISIDYSEGKGILRDTPIGPLTFNFLSLQSGLADRYSISIRWGGKITVNPVWYHLSWKFIYSFLFHKDFVKCA